MLAIFKNKKIMQLLYMFALTLLLQVFLLLKTSITASLFGSSVEMDAYNFSNNIANFIFSFIGAGATTVLIPSIIARKDIKSINIFINVIYIFAIICLFVTFIFRKEIISFFSTGTTQFINIASELLVITLLTHFITSFTGITNAVYQCEEKFNIPKIINLLSNIGLVILLLISLNLTINMYSWIILISTAVGVFFQILFVKSRYYKYTLDFNLKNTEFRRMLSSFGPIALSTGLYQVSLIIDTILSSRLGEGQISNLTYTNNIISMVNTVILANIMIYVYPKIATVIQTGSQLDIKKKIEQLIIFLNILMFGIVGLLIVCGKDAIVILYQRGAFGSENTNVVFICMIIYILSLPTNAIRDLIYRYFYSKGQTFIPFRNSLITSIFNIIISLILSNYIGIYGIVFGTTISSYIGLMTIIRRFKKSLGLSIFDKDFLTYNFKLLFKSILAMVIVVIIMQLISINYVFLSVIMTACLFLCLYGLNITRQFKSLNF